MEKIEILFWSLLDRGAAAVWLMLAAMLFRGLLRDAPKSLRCVLWGLAAVRLLCPVSVESTLSLAMSFT